MTDIVEVFELLKKDKRFKDVMVAKGNDPKLEIKKLPTGVPMLDELLCGGVPLGKQTLIYGDSHVGKTWILMMLVKMAQSLGMSTAFLDVDKGFEPRWWQTVGVDINKFDVIQPNYGEQAIDIVESLVKAGTDLVMVDSIDLLVPTVEANASMDEISGYPKLASLVGSGLRKIKRVNTKTAFVCTNHVREGIGRYASMKLGPGGKAQEDMSSLMLLITRGGVIKENEVVKGGSETKKVGFTMRVTVEKDKIHGRRWEQCEMPFLFESGQIDVVGSLIEMCLEAGYITKIGGWYDVFGERILGKLGVKKVLEDKPELLEKLKNTLTGAITL